MSKDKVDPGTVRKIIEIAIAVLSAIAGFFVAGCARHMLPF